MITVLCVRKDSIYKELGADCYDAERDMRTWPGGNAVVAHPPCAQWGALKYFAHENESERLLAVECIAQVRRWGGVLEHPVASGLWRPSTEFEALPRPGFSESLGRVVSVCKSALVGSQSEKNHVAVYCRGFRKGAARHPLYAGCDYARGIVVHWK